MRLRFIVAGFLVVTATTAAVAWAGQPNPKKCILNSPRACAEQSAITAVKKTMARRTGNVWDANLSCTTRSAKLLVWHCAWTSGTGGSATVTFRGTKTGWHTYVTVKPVG